MEFYKETMHQNDFVIFAELNRDHFDEMLRTLADHFDDIQSGRQGDDWIWVHLGEDKIEIDSFYSMELEVKGKYKHLAVARQIIQSMDGNWILQVFDPPRMDLTR
jgi:hypothetical protein